MAHLPHLEGAKYQGDQAVVQERTLGKEVGSLMTTRTEPVPRSSGVTTQGQLEHAQEMMRTDFKLNPGRKDYSYKLDGQEYTIKYTSDHFHGDDSHLDIMREPDPDIRHPQVTPDKSGHFLDAYGIEHEGVEPEVYDRSGQRVDPQLERKIADGVSRLISGEIASADLKNLKLTTEERTAFNRMTKVLEGIGDKEPTAADAENLNVIGKKLDDNGYMAVLSALLDEQSINSAIKYPITPEATKPVNSIAFSAVPIGPGQRSELRVRIPPDTFHRWYTQQFNK